jgi:hypothetical protein
MGNWHLFFAGALVGMALMIFGAILAHLYIYGF